MNITVKKLYCGLERKYGSTAVSLDIEAELRKIALVAPDGSPITVSLFNQGRRQRLPYTLPDTYMLTSLAPGSQRLSHRARLLQTDAGLPPTYIEDDWHDYALGCTETSQLQRYAKLVDRAADMAIRQTTRDAKVLTCKQALETKRKTYLGLAALCQEGQQLWAQIGPECQINEAFFDYADNLQDPIAQ